MYLVHGDIGFTAVGAVVFPPARFFHARRRILPDFRPAFLSKNRLGAKFAC